MSSKPPKKRLVAVTGLGIISPVGLTVSAFWDSLLEGRSGIGPLTRFDTSGFAFTRAGEVRGFRLPEAVASQAHAADLGTQFMLAASLEALHDAHLETPVEREPVGIVFSSNFGGMLSGERFLEQRMSGHPRSSGLFREFVFQKSADWAAQGLGLAGPRAVLSLSCSSGAHALACGADWIRAGRVSLVLTGGYDTISRFAWSGLSCLRTMTRGEVRPFDRTRDGTIFSEGAAALVLEELEHAKARGARMHALLLGHGHNNNAFHMTAPDRGGAGLALAMRMALADASITPEEVDHINTHGTGTPHNDRAETEAIKAVFGPRAHSIPITANKSIIGHMMGAAGSAEAIAAILTLRDGIIPPTIHYAEPDPECDLDCVPNIKRAVPVQTVLTNSSGIGGCNAVVVFRKPY